ncbi:OprD family outer membrane porin [Hydrogenimonas sp.]
MNAIRYTLLSGLLLSISPLHAQEVKSFRAQTGEVNPIEHLRAELRGGYLSAGDGGDSAALGGHIHIDTRSWNGLRFGAAFYTVQKIGSNTGSSEFFDNGGESFSLLSEAFLRYNRPNLSITAGRQMIETPHADSDDIRMIPNYFSGVTLRSGVGEGWRIEGGWIDRMAGWENGVDASRFVDIGKVFGAADPTGGFWMAGIGFEAQRHLSASLWLYRFEEIADILYVDIATEFAFDRALVTAGIQYDRATESGMAAIGPVDASTWGAMAEVSFDSLHTNIQAAYNRSTGKSGAFGSLGGGPFYTSMEVLTIDALEESGHAWSAGCLFHLPAEGLAAGIVYGHFRSDDPAHFDTVEGDIILDYTIGSRFTLTTAYAVVDDRTERDDDFRQLRMIANYHF